MTLRTIVLVMLACVFGIVVPASPKSNTKIAHRLLHVLETTHQNDELLVWVFFTDKGKHAPFPQDLVTEKSLRRRRKVLPAEEALTPTDLPVQPAYVRAVASRVLSMRHRTKWMNGVSAIATPSQIEKLSALPFVRSIDLVVRFARKGTGNDLETLHESRSNDELQSTAGPTALDYGPSSPQISQIRVDSLHAMGFDGTGVLVAHFDNGHRLLSHEVFDSMTIAATYDFVDNDPDPAPEPSDPAFFGAHGISTLSVIGGFAPGRLIGPAYGSTYLLARTENDASETPLEEDNWVAAIEWADSIGADVVTSSVAYLDYDAGHPSWTWEDMDGNTTVITRAADMAVARGIVVVNSAGNSGFNSTRNTLLAPADGDSVITVGSVDGGGNRSSFSSVGPTTDSPPRTKPDVVARGSSAHVAGTSSTSAYGPSSGTSYSAPLTAGVAALLLSAHPGATPMQIREALRLTASQATAPDNLRGWGIVDAVAALHYLETGEVPQVPIAYRLDPNFPNPFNPPTSIVYALQEESFVTLSIHDVRGRQVRLLVRGSMPAREHVVLFNGRDDDGHRLGSGVYIYRIRVTSAGTRGPRSFAASKKMVLLK